MAVSPISPRMRRMQWIAIGLVTAAIALNYLDRSTLATDNVKIRQEFGISATAIGALQSAWSITYALCQVPIGYFLDRLGPRWLVVVDVTGSFVIALAIGAGITILGSVLLRTLVCAQIASADLEGGAAIAVPAQ